MHCVASSLTEFNSDNLSYFLCCASLCCVDSSRNLLECRCRHYCQHKMQSITSADLTHPHISSHIFIRYSFSSDFLGLAVKLLSNSICFPRPVAAYWLFEASALVMREISFLSLSAAKPLLTGTRAGRLWGYLEIHTHTVGRPGQE